MQTFFTFADGALGYDCATCRQRCCRGKGFAFAAEELVPLLRKAPHLAPHLHLRAGGTFGAHDLAERCWFLGDAGLCSIEVEHGRDAKPSTCRLFPFNRVYRLGEVRIVDVNSLLCPVAAAAGQGVRHADLEQDLAALAGSSLIDVPASPPAGLPDDWLDRERVVADVAASHPADSAALVAAAGGAPLAASWQAWARAYGVADDELAGLEAGVAPRVALLASTLRWNAIFGREAPAYAVSAARLPAQLRGLVLLGALAARSLGAPPSLRGLTELFRDQAPVLRVMARWGEPVKLAAPRFDADLAPLLQPALGALLAGAFRGGRTLGELVLTAADTLPPPQRPLAFALAARQLPTLLPT